MSRPITTSAVRAVQRGVRIAIVSVFVEGLRRDNLGAVVNGVVALATSYLPSLLEWRYDVSFRPWQRLFTETAMFAHAFGMLGRYEDTWWWDHVTHTASAGILGSIVHVAARRADRDPRPYVLAIVAGGGVVWEAGEYVIHWTTDRLNIDPVLIPYSARDSVLDLVFNVVGALVVVRFGDRLLGNFYEEGADGDTEDEDAETGEVGTNHVGTSEVETDEDESDSASAADRQAGEWEARRGDGSAMEL